MGRLYISAWLNQEMEKEKKSTTQKCLTQPWITFISRPH